MTEMDRPSFAEMMVGLSETYDSPVSEARMSIYWQALCDLPIAAVRASANAHVRMCKFFPRPADLREAIDGSDQDRASIAWAELVKEVRRVGWCGTPTFSDPIIHRAALDLYGGWQALCELLPAGGPEMLGAAKRFEATYAAYARRSEREQIALPPSKDEARKALGNLRLELVKRSLPTGDLGA